MAEAEIVARVERRRKWTEVEKAGLLAEVDAEGGKVSVVARRHGISDSLIYNWRAALKAAAAHRSALEPVAFVPIGVMGRAADGRPALLPAPAPSMRAFSPPLTAWLPQGRSVRSHSAHSR